MRVILCFFGVVPRSIKYVYPRIKEKLINPIREKYNLDIYVFNLNVKKTEVDGIELDQDDCNIVEYDFFEERLQSDFDLEMKEFCNKCCGQCSIQSKFYPKKIIKNSIRAMYSEYRSSQFLEKNKDKYDVAIIISPDYYPVNMVSIEDLEYAKENKDVIFTSNQADWLDGYTDGYYIGHIEPIIKVTGRYEKLSQYLPTKGNYECILRKSFEKNGIKRKVTKMSFFKVRANKDIKMYGKQNESYEELERKLHLK